MTKLQLIHLLQQHMDIPDQSEVHVSVNQEDIMRVRTVEVSPHPDGKGTQFLIDFSVE